MKRGLIFLFSAACSPLAAESTAKVSHLHLGKVFQAAPIIYSVLIAMSILSFVIWLYTLLTLRLADMAPPSFLNSVRQMLSERQFEAAITRCEEDRNFCSSIIRSGISARRHGPQVMMDAMQSEGRRCGSTLWQRISVLSDVAVVAPMFGLLGTVLGLFFAFYESDRSAETINGIFDGLGIAIGTTVAGLIVAIMAMLFYTSLKFRLVGLLNAVENEVLSLVTIVDLDESPTSSNS